MRFVLAALALGVSVPAGAVTVYTGTLDPVEGLTEWNFTEFLQAKSIPILSTFSFSIDNGVIYEANIYADYLYSNDIFDPGPPRYNSGNDYYYNDGCFYNSVNPDGCFNTFADEFTSPGTHLSGLLVNQRSLSFSVLQPRSYDVCTDTSIGQCSYFWRGQVNPVIKIASHRPVQYSFTIGTLAAAVPEPASWAMMVAGFGLMGFALRRPSRARITATVY